MLHKIGKNMAQGAGMPLYHYRREHVFRAGLAPIYARHNHYQLDEGPHNHDFMEIVLVWSGRAEHRCPAGVHSLRAGDVVVLRPGAWHAYEQSRNLVIWNCCFGLDLLQRELAWTLDDPLLNPLLLGLPLTQGAAGVFIFHMEDQARRDCQRRLRELHRATEGPRPEERPAQIAYLVLALTRLAAALNRAQRRRRRPAPQLHPIAMQAMRLLEADLARPWQTRELAGYLRIDQSYLIRLCKAATGLPPLAYQARLRAERAAALLLRTELSVADIGAQVGWPSPAYFARRFHEGMGMSASEYRQKFRAPGLTPGELPPRSRYT